MRFFLFAPIPLFRLSGRITAKAPERESFGMLSGASEPFDGTGPAVSFHNLT
jgi:hypothetical protein